MSKKIIVNHVMSQDVHSGIFESIINYFKKFSPMDIVHIQSRSPINEADIWHYHRPHLEKSLKENSIVTVHHDLVDTDDWLLYEKFHPRYLEAKKIVCLNTSQLEFLKGHDVGPLVLIPHGFNSEIFQDFSRKKIKEKYTFLITSKRYGRRVKGESYLIELLQWLDNRIVRFVLVGEDRSLDKFYLDKFGFENKVYERLPYKMYGKLYANCDFLLMASLHEGGPANIPEAIASATPVLCNPIGMAKDMVSSEFNGLWLSMSPRKDAHLINSKLRDVGWLDSVFENSLLSSTRTRVVDWNLTTLAYCDVYRSMVA